MPTWVRRNSDGKIIERTDINPSGRFHSSISWEQLRSPTSASVPFQIEANTIPKTIGDLNEEQIAEIAAFEAEQQALINEDAEETEETSNTTTTDSEGA